MSLRKDEFLSRSCRYNICSIPSFRVLFFAILFIFVLVPSVNARGRGRIQNVTVDTVDKNVFVSARLNGGFRKEIVNDIHNGIPKEFYYYLVLKQKEKNWFDEEILSKTIRYTVKYDTLKKNYLVTQGSNGESVEQQVDGFKAMKDIVTQVHKIQIVSTDKLKRGEEYFVSVQSQMQAAKRPFYLDYFLFFIPFLEIDTPWENSPQISFPSLK